MTISKIFSQMKITTIDAFITAVVKKNESRIVTLIGARKNIRFHDLRWSRRWNELRTFHSDSKRGKKRGEWGGERERETDRSSRGNVGKTQSRHKSWDIDSTANFPRSLGPTYRRFILWRGNNISRRHKNSTIHQTVIYSTVFVPISLIFPPFLPPKLPVRNARPFLSVIPVTPRCYGHHTVHTRGVPEASVMLTTDSDFIALVSVVAICLYTNYRRICH